MHACAGRGILVDLSHLNERGFWDVAALEHGPLVASHSGAHALCPSPRNLTDAQLRAIGASGGLVGINFHVGFLRADGADDPDTPLRTIAAHAAHVAEVAGVEAVALGSDFDGATMPRELPDVAALPALHAVLAEAGFGRRARAGRPRELAPCAGGRVADVSLDAAALAADVAALVRVPSVTGDERAALEWLAQRGEALGLGAELVEHDLAALRAHPGHPGEEAPRTSSSASPSRCPARRPGGCA